MAALLVALSVMAIMMTAAMPAWHHAVQREKELELEFRGEQYARAIMLFQRKAGPGVLPPNLDVLIDQKFLRKKYKDPITGDDFQLLRPTQQTATDTSGRGRGNSQFSLSGPAGAGAGRGGSEPLVGGATGGISGVASKSTAESIRIRDGRTRYNEWQFTPVEMNQGLGGPGGGGRGANGQNGGRGDDQSGRGGFDRFGPSGGRGPGGGPGGPGPGRGFGPSGSGGPGAGRGGGGNPFPLPPMRGNPGGSSGSQNPR